MKPTNMRRRRASQRKVPASVICLPPPERMRQPQERTSAIPLPRHPEELVEGAPLAGPANRKMRRQQQRAPLVAMAPAVSAAPAPLAAQTPLPRNRSLTIPQGHLVARLRVWLSTLWRKALRPASQQRVALPAAQELRALRRDVARLRASLDAMLKRAAARQ